MGESGAAPTSPKDEEKEVDPAAERAAAAEAQNLPEGAVPEQRPQASQRLDDADAESELTKKLREAGELPETNKPMPQEAYDRADSDAQKAKAAKTSVSEGPMVGNVVVSTKGPHEGRVFAVTRVVTEGSVGDAVRRLAGDPAQVQNQPKEIELRAIGDERDGEALVLNVEEHGLEKQNEAFRGTRAGRRH